MDGSNVTNVLVYTHNINSPVTDSICLQTHVYGSPKSWLIFIQLVLVHQYIMFWFTQKWVVNW